MEDLDHENANCVSDEDLLMKEVIRGEADLLFLDAYLSEILRKR